jgi:hypothetical protein
MITTTMAPTLKGAKIEFNTPGAGWHDIEVQA